MFDMKPDAPREIRGEFRPMKSNVPGMEFCELFPNLAKCADKFAIIRTIADSGIAVGLMHGPGGYSLVTYSHGTGAPAVMPRPGGGAGTFPFPFALNTQNRLLARWQLNGESAWLSSEIPNQSWPCWKPDTR